MGFQAGQGWLKTKCNIRGTKTGRKKEHLTVLSKHRVVLGSGLSPFLRDTRTEVQSPCLDMLIS